MIECSVLLLNVEMFNQGAWVGEWLKLPYKNHELEAIVNNMGLDSKKDGVDKEYFISECSDNLGLSIFEYRDLENLNSLIKEVKSLGYNKDTIKSINEETKDLEKTVNILQKLKI